MCNCNITKWVFNLAGFEDCTFKPLKNLHRKLFLRNQVTYFLAVTVLEWHTIIHT